MKHRMVKDGTMPNVQALKPPRRPPEPLSTLLSKGLAALDIYFREKQKADRGHLRLLPSFR